MSSFPIGTAPQQAIAVFFVDPATGLPLNVGGGSAPAGQPSFPISKAPQESMPVFFVAPTSGLPL